MYVEAWQVRATAILVTAMVLVFGYYFLALVLLVVALAATITQIEPGNAKPQCEGPPADAVMEVRFDSKTEEVAAPDPIDALDVDSKQEQAKTWTDSVMLADTGVAMPAAQVARAWLQMARSKDIVLAPSKPRPSRPVVRAGSSSDLCGSITEGDTDPCSEVTPRGRRTLVVDIERADRAEPWGFQWRSGIRRWILDSLEDNSLASAWNQQQAERGFRSLQLGSALLEANGSKHKVVVKQELDTALHLQLTFLLPDEGLIERLDAQSLECRIKNSFLEVTAADSHDERRNFSDPGPIIAKSVSSAPEGYGSCGGPVDNTGGYVTESEAVSDLIGSTALIVGAAPHTGKFCRIEAFDPQVRRYVVRVYADGGPVSAKLRLENLMLQPSLPSFPAPVTSFQDYPAPLPVQPEAVLNPYSQLPWSWPEAPPVFPSVSDAMLMQNFPHPWAPVGDASWSQYAYDGYGMPTMLGSEISMEGPPMLPCMQPSVPSLPPLSTTPVTSLPIPFEGPATLPIDRPLMIHAHQTLEQQVTRQHMDLEEELIAQAAQSEVKSAEAFDLQDPRGLQGHPGEHPGELLGHDGAPEPAGTEPEVKKKRRRRRRGKRKGQKADAADAEEQDSGSEDLDPTVGPAAAQACDVLHAKDEAEPDGFGKADDAGFSSQGPQGAQGAQGSQESWRPRLPRQFETDLEQEGAEGIHGTKDSVEADVFVSLNTERGRAADWRPSLPRSLVATKVAKEKADGAGNPEVPQPEPMESKSTPWQPSLHRAKLHKQDHTGANPKGSDRKSV